MMYSLEDYMKRIQILEKENAALDKQKEYLKKQGDELAITVSNLVIENKALKEELEDLKKTFDKIYAENKAVNQTNDLKIAQLLQLEEENADLKKQIEDFTSDDNSKHINALLDENKKLKLEMASVVERATEDNRKLREKFQNLKENAMAISFDYDEETEFVPTEVRCHFCNYLMGTMTEWGKSIVTDSKCPECKSDRFVFIKKEVGK